MDLFSKLLRGPAESKPPPDYASEFHDSWNKIQETLSAPDERQISRGIQSTEVPSHLRSMTDSLVRESTQYEDSTGPCLEYLLRNDVLNALVKLSEEDRPFGIQAEVLRTISNLVVLLDEKFLVHSTVHKAVIRLLQACMGEEITEQTAGKGKAMGAAGAAGRLSPSEYEEDLVNLLCILCSRIRTYPELLLIFFQDKNWASHHTPLMGSDFSNSDEEEEEEGEAGGTVVVEEATSSPSEDESQEEAPEDASDADSSATPTKQTVLLAQAFARSNAPSPSSSAPRSIRSAPPPIPKPHYEFLIFTYLMRFIHREGAIGEYGRAGLLFLLDIAMSAHEIKSQSQPISHDPLSEIAIALAEYILEGDFAEVLGAGLGAVYSLLPWKLELRKEDGGSDAPSHGGGMVLGIATIGTMEEEKRRIELEENRVRKLGADVSTSPEFKTRLDHFLKLLQFVQDVLKRLEVSTITEGTVQANEGKSGSDDGSESPALVGRAIALSILDSIRSIFLQNVLYPSILECSEADGSAVAVLSYINFLLCTLRRGPLTNVLLDFLTSEDETSGKENHVPQTPAIRRSMAKKKALRRRSSAMVLLSLEAPQTTSDAPEYFNSLGRFTLKDLLVTNLSADKHDGIAPLQTGVGVLTLLRTLTSQYCAQSVETLLTVGRDPAPHRLPSTFDDLWEEEEDVSDDEEEFVYTGVDASPQTTPKPRRKLKSFRHIDILLQPDTTISTQIMEQKMYLNLVQKIDGAESANVFSTKYDHYLGDAIESIRCHQCSSGLGAGPSIRTRSKTRHRLRPTDPLISALLQSLRAFFAHSPEYNLALTGVIAEISSCPERSLAGWLTLAPKEETSNAWNIQGPSFEPRIQDGESDGEQSDDALVDARLRAENPALGFDYRLKEQAAMPVLYTIFSGLVAQLDRYRAMVDDLDSFLSERRKGLLFSENLNDALNLMLDVDPQFDPPKLTSTATTTPKKSSSQPATPPSTVTPKPKSKGGMSFMPSFLTSKKKSGSTPGEQSSTPTKKRTSGEIPASPFVPHYQQTVAVEVQAFAAPPPSEGPWSPEARKPKSGFGSFSLESTGGFGTEADVFSTPDPRMNPIREEGSGDESDNEREDTGKTITLSQLLDNVVLLEEAIKELTAIIQARVSLGIDEVRYI
ncbi:hypothetical protein M407DRAFT_233707 [Tulasnella calospora MUT 4182]|uniref:FHF complex subunit HOOK-interacting protein C-terminal domain-containing protein n=1 Tax=Tulasnella calospora MUT 4182 TaxID=1051891 RepID=A0A0C3QJ40_9AGAM|nr:hypothetical protein M407DRAFT_233707 [Tulasnella calospora MUT 4182]